MNIVFDVPGDTEVAFGSQSFLPCRVFTDRIYRQMLFTLVYNYIWKLLFIRFRKLLSQHYTTQNWQNYYCTQVNKTKKQVKIFYLMFTSLWHVQMCICMKCVFKWRCCVKMCPIRMNVAEVDLFETDILLSPWLGQIFNPYYGNMRHFLVWSILQHGLTTYKSKIFVKVIDNNF